MKTLIITLCLFASTAAHAGDCFRKAQKAGEKAAMAYHDESVLGTSVINPRSQDVVHGRLVTVYDLFVSTCASTEDDECKGALTYEVVTVENELTCKVVRVTLVGEE